MSVADGNCGMFPALIEEGKGLYALPYYMASSFIGSILY